MVSIGQRSQAMCGRSTGFDYLRIILALGVMVWHAFPLSYGATGNSGYDWANGAPIASVILPMFFALSGFLVAGSLERNSILSFVGLRVIRIVPALAVDVFLSAIVLGPVLTSYPLQHYFCDARFYSYFLNVLGYIHYQLPGLFISNPYPNVVNGQLWTVPWELRCYIALTGLAILGIVRRRAIFVALTLVAMAAAMTWHLPGHTGNWGVALFFGFLMGVTVYQFKELLPWDWRMATVNAAAMAVLLFIPSAGYLIAFPAAYLTVYLGLLNPRKIFVLRGADYSYGLYLYGFVIQRLSPTSFLCRMSGISAFASRYRLQRCSQPRLGT